MLALLPYFAIAILAPSLTYIAQQTSPVNERRAALRILLNPFDISAIALLVIFAGTRLDIGTDYSLYTGIYNRLTVDDWAFSIARSPQEFGFSILSLAMKSFGLSAEEFLFVVSALTVSAVYVAVRYASPRPAFSLLLYILFATYLSPMNTARQGLAIAFMLLAAIFAARSRIWAVLLVTIACTVHISAIIALVLFALVRFLRINVLGFLASMIGVIFIGRLIPTFPGLVQFLGSLNERYETYLTSGAAAGFGTILVSATHAILALSLLQAKGLSTEEAWWRNAYTLTAPLALLGTAVLVAARLSDYTAVLLPLVAATACSNFKRPELARWGFISVGIVYYVAYLLKYGGLLPYQSWLF